MSDEEGAYNDGCDADKGSPGNQLEGVDGNAAKSWEVEDFFCVKKPPVWQATFRDLLHKIHEGLPEPK